MFEDSNEPQDIFAGTDPVSDTPVPGQTPGSNPNPSQAVVRRGPPRWLFVLIVLVIVGGLGGGGYWFFVLRGSNETMEFDAPDCELLGNCDATTDNGAMMEDNNEMSNPSDPTTETVQPADPGVVDQNATEPNPPGDGTAPPVLEQPTATDEAMTDTEPATALAAPPVTSATDTDADGLSDEDEALAATDPTNPDTDGDGLTDGEEVNIYQTDPLKPDTDGDGYLDGEEVRGGYNPNGEGRLIDLTPTP